MLVAQSGSASVQSSSAQALSVGKVSKLSSTAPSTAPVDRIDIGALKIRQTKAAPSITLLLDSTLMLFRDFT